MSAWSVALRRTAVAALGGALRPAAPDRALRRTAAVESPGFVKFNDPFGSEARQYALIRHIDTKIDRAPRGATVRVAAYSFAMRSTTDALVRAHRRGVVVKVVVDRHSTQWAAVPRLARELGTSTTAAQLRQGLLRLLPGHRRRPARQVRDDLEHRQGRAAGDGRLDELHLQRGRQPVAGPLHRRPGAGGLRAAGHGVQADGPRPAAAAARAARGRSGLPRRRRPLPVVRRPDRPAAHPARRRALPGRHRRHRVEGPHRRPDRDARLERRARLRRRAARSPRWPRRAATCASWPASASGPRVRKALERGRRRRCATARSTAGPPTRS